MFCPHCGKEVSEEQLFCQHCGARLREEAGPAAEAIPPAGTREKTPWENREVLGFFTGLFRTLNDTLFRPSEFFRRMPVSGGITDPLLYGLIVGMAGLMFSYLWQFLTQGTMQNVMPGMQTHYLFPGTGLALLAFFSPFLVIIGLFITAGILHVCLMMVKGATSPFEATFRVASYGSSANIFLIIPFCGNLVALVWLIVLYIIGLREAHETTGGKAAFAVFLPAIVCCGLVLFGTALFLGAAAGSLGMFMQMQK